MFLRKKFHHGDKQRSALAIQYRRLPQGDRTAAAMVTHAVTMTAGPKNKSKTSHHHTRHQAGKKCVSENPCKDRGRSSKNSKIKRGLKGDKTVWIIIVILLSSNTSKVTRREVHNHKVTSFHGVEQNGYGVQHSKTAEDRSVALC